MAGEISDSMTVQAELRSMSLGEILDRTFAIYRSRFSLFAGLAALPAAAILGIHCADNAWWHVRSRVHPYRQPGIFLWGLAVSLGYYHISGFLTNLTLPAFVRACSNELFGESTSILSSLRFALARWRTYLWLAILKMCAVLVVPETLALLLLFGGIFLLDKLGFLEGTGLSPAAGVVFLFILGAFALFLWAGACLAYAMPAAALEGLAGLKALRRSWVLSRGSRWRVVVAWLLVSVCSLILNTMFAYLAMWIAILLYRGHHYARLNYSVYLTSVYALFAATACVLGPLYPLAVTVLYYDQRVRKEGYDLVKMLDAAEKTAAAATAEQDGISGPIAHEASG